MKSKKIFLNIIKDLFKPINLYYFVFGITVISFKYAGKYYPGIIAILIIINELCALIRKLRYRREIRTLRWILGISLILSFGLSSAIIGYVILLNTIIDRIAGILRKNIKFNKRFNTTKKDFSGLFFFWIIGFLAGVIFFYYHQGYILKTQGISIFITAIFAGLMESVNPFMFNDNISISTFSGIFMYLTKFIDFNLHISGFNFIFSFIVCAIFVVILLLLDIIKFKETFMMYVILLLFYNGLGYYLFVFNVLILIGYGTFYKIEKIYIERKRDFSRIFIKLQEIKNYFLISLIIAIIFLFIPHYRFIKLALATGLLTGLCFNTIDLFDKLWGKKFFSILDFRKKLMKSDETISLEGLESILGLSLIYLILGYFLHIFRLKEIPVIFVVCNIIWYISKFSILRWNLSYINFRSIRFLITYIPFAIVLIINMR